jgi:hypothetical protein
MSLAWHVAAFSGAAQAGKLKPLDKYLKKSGQGQSPREMLTVLQAIKGAGAAMTIKQVKRD